VNDWCFWSDNGRIWTDQVPPLLKALHETRCSAKKSLLGLHFADCCVAILVVAFGKRGNSCLSTIRFDLRSNMTRLKFSTYLEALRSLRACIGVIYDRFCLFVCSHCVDQYVVLLSGMAHHMVWSTHIYDVTVRTSTNRPLLKRRGFWNLFTSTSLHCWITIIDARRRVHGQKARQWSKCWEFLISKSVFYQMKQEGRGLSQKTCALECE